MDLNERIALGTQFLDSVKPGWAGEIDLEELDLSMPSSCVLGQLFEAEADAYDAVGAFTVGSWAAHDWLDEQGYDLEGESAEFVSAAEMCGFEREGMTSGWPDVRPDNTYDALEAAWTEVIESRVAR